MILGLQPPRYIMGSSGVTSTDSRLIAIGGRLMTTPSEDYRTIPLTKEQIAIVDASDYDWLNQWKWTAEWKEDAKTFYATRVVSENGKQCHIYMHRLILGLAREDRRLGDHRDFDGINNRRFNLRISTRRQNQSHQRKRSDNTSGFKGVTKHKATGKFFAAIRLEGGKRKYFPLTNTAEESYRNYCEAAKEIHGEFARLA